MHTPVSSVQFYGQRSTWPENVIYVGMPGPAAREFGITDDIAGPFGKPWNLLQDPRGWKAAYRIYLFNRLQDDPEFRTAVLGLHGKTLLCWCRAKAAKRGTPVSCHADILARAVEYLAHHE